MYFVQESLHNHPEDIKPEKQMTETMSPFKQDGEIKTNEVVHEGVKITISDDDDEIQRSKGWPNSKLSLLKNWPLMSSIFVYCIFQLHDIAYSEV